jgi:hypothetical protein
VKNRLVESGRQPQPGRKVFTRRRRPSLPWAEFLLSLLHLGIGAGVLAALWQLPSRFDSLLLVSKVIGTVLSGLGQIGLGVLKLATGLIQLLGLLLVAGLAIGALLFLANGLFRLLRLALPGVGNVLRVPAELARLLWSVVQIRPPQRPDR